MYNYIKEGKIGRGSSSDVLLVRHKETDQIFALKRVHLTEDQKWLPQEVNVLQKLKHPNIIKYYESFIHQDHLCIVMEYAPYGDLQKRINQIKAQGSEEFSQIQLCDVLLYLHNAKIIHRDIKAQNIFLNKNEEIILGDFGICKVMTSTQDCSNTQIGTPYNFPPELVQGKCYNTQSDCWGLGCVLYELCTLSRPFEGQSFVCVLENILTQTPKKLSQGFSEDMQLVIDSLLEKDPKRRLSISQLLKLPQVINQQKQISLIRELNPRSLRSNFQINSQFLDKSKIHKSFTDNQVKTENQQLEIQQQTGSFPQSSLMENIQESNNQNQREYLEDFSPEQQDNNEKNSQLLIKNIQQVKKPYQREIQINIPTPTERKQSQLTQETQKEVATLENQIPWSAPSNYSQTKTPTEKRDVKTCTSNRKSSVSVISQKIKEENCPTKQTGQVKYFTFGESLLKKAPTSPNRPMLIQNFIRQKLGDSIFCQVVNAIKEYNMDAVTFLKQKSDLLVKIVGQENIPIVDLGAHAGALSFDWKQQMFTSPIKNQESRANIVSNRPDCTSPEPKKQMKWNIENS